MIRYNYNYDICYHNIYIELAKKILTRANNSLINENSITLDMIAEAAFAAEEEENEAERMKNSAVVAVDGEAAAADVDDAAAAEANVDTDAADVDSAAATDVDKVPPQSEEKSKQNAKRGRKKKETKSKEEVSEAPEIKVEETECAKVNDDVDADADENEKKEGEENEDEMYENYTFRDLHYICLKVYQQELLKVAELEKTDVISEFGNRLDLIWDKIFVEPGCEQRFKDLIVNYQNSILKGMKCIKGIHKIYFGLMFDFNIFHIMHRCLKEFLTQDKVISEKMLDELEEELERQMAFNIRRNAKNNDHENCDDDSYHEFLRYMAEMGKMEENEFLS